MKMVMLTIYVNEQYPETRSEAPLLYDPKGKPYVELEGILKKPDGSLTKRRVLYLNEKALDPVPKIEPFRSTQPERLIHRELLRQANAVEVDW